MGEWVSYIDSKPKFYFGAFVIFISILMGGYAAYWNYWDTQGLFISFAVFLFGLFWVWKSYTRYWKD